MEFSIISAFTKKDRGIGFQNKIPWYNKDDIKLFREITTKKHPLGQNCVIMGRNTWDSLPNNFRPLPNRVNIVVTKTLKNIDNVIVVESLEEALAKSPSTNIFVIGGEQLYKEAIKHKLCKKLYISEIDNDVKCDKFFPTIPIYFKKTKEEIKNDFTLYEYENFSDINSQENIYLNLLKTILSLGENKNDRTGTGTLSLFGNQLKFSLINDTIPLLTTKKVYWKGVVEELLFFLRGEHDNRKLQEKNVHIWDGNTNRDFLDKITPHLETNDLGKAYGVQWRATGAHLLKINESYKGKGIDQLKIVINLLKNDPNSRRIIINSWNVTDLKDMCLPPCHMMYQFYVRHGKFLSCMMTQRSADMFLGLPFNIASTALLTKIIAKTVNLIPDEIIINLGDAHIYKNHIEQVKTQLSRRPMKFPTLLINKKLENVEDIENLSFDDFILNNYNSWPAIKADMVV